MVEDKIREEVLYREGLAMGLDKDDTIVKRRMAQKMQFLAEDVAAAHEPSTDELKAWFDKNSQKFALPSRYSFRHLYFSPDKRGKNAQDDAAKALTKIAGQPEDSSFAASLADQFMFQDYYGDRTPERDRQGVRSAIRRRPRKAQARLVAGSDRIRLRLASGICGHRDSGTHSGVRRNRAGCEDRMARRAETHAWQKAYAEMRAKYTVLLPAAPSEAAQAPSATPPAKKQVPGSSGEAPL